MAAGLSDPALNAIWTCSASVRSVNKIIGAFILISLFTAISFLHQDINYENWTAKTIRNGETIQQCFNATAAVSNYPSFWKLFELEAYLKIGFRFALMFPATSRVFHAFIRYKYFQLKTLKGNPNQNGRIFGVIYKLTPYLLAVQTILSAAMLIFDANKTAPLVIQNLIVFYICSTILYMILVMILDIRESQKNPLRYFFTPRYVARLIGFVCFAICVFPTSINFLNYLKKKECNFFASTPLAAFTEYLTIAGISVFHFSELFDLELVHFIIFENE